MDSRITTLAQNLINYSTSLQKEEKILIESIGERSKDLVRALVKETHRVGGIPFVTTKDNAVMRALARAIMSQYPADASE